VYSWVVKKTSKTGLDMALILPIITSNNSVDEDEYIFKRRHREQRKLRSCPNAKIEWTSELQGERLGRVSLAGTATVIRAKGISSIVSRT
jgi:hypothetical protein